MNWIFGEDRKSDIGDACIKDEIKTNCIQHLPTGGLSKWLQSPSIAAVCQISAQALVLHKHYQSKQSTPVLREKSPSRHK